MQAYGKKTPVNLLTGFLGAGKTTLLKRLLSEPSLEGTAVLVNEFGEIGLDHLLLEEVDEEIVLLQSGCVCCTIRGDLKDAMLRLHGRAHRGEIPPFERLAIETTGLADPAPIVATLSADPVLRNHYRLGNIVTVVDAINGVDTLQRFHEARKQVAIADRIILTKTDRTKTEIDGLIAHLQAHNPTAGIRAGGIDLPISYALFTNDLHDEATRLAEVEKWLEWAPDPHHHHTDKFGCFALETPHAIDWAAFGLWLSMLLNRHGQDILRIKGILNIKDMDVPVVVNGVQHTIHRPLHLKTWPNDMPSSKLVVISNALAASDVQGSFNRIVLQETGA